MYLNPMYTADISILSCIALMNYKSLQDVFKI